MVAKIDLPEGRRRCVKIGSGIAVAGLILVLLDFRVGTAFASLGTAFALWAVLHKDRGLPVPLSQACRSGQHDACPGSMDPSGPLLCYCACHFRGGRTIGIERPIDRADFEP